MIRKYYRTPLDHIPFKEIPSLENSSIKVGYLSYLSLAEKMNMDVNLTTVYDRFDDEVTVGMLRKSPYLFGQVVSFGDVGNTKARLKLIGSEEVEPADLDYPDMKLSNSQLPPNNDPARHWFYLSNGKYIGMHAKRTEFSKVRHLESITLCGIIDLRVRIIVELLKRNVKNGLVSLKEKDFLEIAVLVLLADPNLRSKNRFSDAQEIAHSIIPDMLFTPLWEEIPDNLKGRVAV